MKIVFMLEEQSMLEVPRIVLPKVIPETVALTFIPQQGKSDLEKSLPIKLKGWKEPGIKFVVLRDQDSSDCKQLKDRLQKICASAF